MCVCVYIYIYICVCMYGAQGRIQALPAQLEMTSASCAWSASTMYVRLSYLKATI